MLTTIHITVRDRVPIITAGEDVISHNSDYAAEFEFDEEWQDKIKTVYFVCEDGSYQAVVMDGNSCDVPMMAGEHRRIFVGVQEGTSVKPGKLKTTRPCCLKVKDSIADYLGQPIPDPAPDVYEQIIAMLNNLTTPAWGAVQNKPFESIGDGLEVDENGVLSAPGGTGGSPNAVQYVAQSLTDEQKTQARENIGAKATTEKSAYIISKTRSYGYIHTSGMDFDGVYALIQSGKVVMLLVDNSASYYGVITTVTDKTIVFYNIRDISQSDVGKRNKGITYFGFTWHKGDDSLTEWWGDIPSVEVDETLTKSSSAADAKAVGDALGTKLDKNQGAANAGKILGIGDDGNVIPQDKPTYTAEEVGALPNTTVIPTVPATLPNPQKLTFTGAVTGEYDGSSALTVDIPQGGDSLVIPEQRIALDNAMLVGSVTHVGTVLETNTEYMHTEKIKLNSHKSFQLTGKDASGNVIHIALRYVTAYDAEGKVISAYSLQNVAEASASVGRVVQMDAAVDSVVVSVYKPERYTDKTFILPSVVRDVASALAEKITAPTTAAVGQIIKVKSVDAAGKPTEWEAADLPSGGSVTDEQVNTAVSAWLTEHPEATTTVADGSITPDKLSNAEYLWQIFNPTEYLAGVSYAVINTNNGVVTSHSDTRYKVTPFIACDYDTYVISIPYAAMGLRWYNSAGTPCCYDSNRVFLGVATMSDWVRDGTTANVTFTTVEGTKYIRFSTNSIDNAESWTKGYVETIVICKGGVVYPYYFVGKIAIWDRISIADSARDNTIDGKKLLDNSIEGVKFKDLSVTKDKIAEVSPEVIYGCDFKNLFDKELYDLAGRVTTHYIRGGWLNSSGALSDAANALGSWVTLFIPCIPNTTYALYAFNDAGETTTSYFRNYISYRDKTSIKVIEAVAVGEAVITTPADTYYICVTLSVNDQATQQKIINRMMLVKANEAITSYYPYMVRPHWLKTDNFADGTQIICYGDSLTQNKYPSKLAILLGVLVTDAGVGGNTIAQIYNRVGNYGTNYAIVTLMVGTNDNGGQTSCPLGTVDDEAATDDNATDTSTTYVSRLKRLINKIKITHPGATYVIMPPFEHTWSNFSGLVDVMRQVAELYSIPFLDIFHLCGFRGTDTADAALYLSDGTHENDLGAQRIAELLAGFIKQLKGA